MKVRELPQCNINKMKAPIETVYAVSPQNSSARTGYAEWILDFPLGATDTAVSVLLFQFGLRAALKWGPEGLTLAGREVPGVGLLAVDMHAPGCVSGGNQQVRCEAA